ncbi:MAG: hypothetical protein ACKVKM_11690, partial [Verrucomicrobiia bacterium]
MRQLIAILTLIPVGVVAAPIVPGLHGKHGLDQMHQGRLLITELRCAGCHASDTVKHKKGPDLSAVGSR